MILFPNCKINLGLHILRKRPDGFHDLETIFYPAPLHDALEIIQTEKGGKDVCINMTGLQIDALSEDNICVKAYRLLKKDFPHLPSVQMHLHKTIPSGAGLGGGSADGAFTLILLNKKFGLELTEDRLIAYALQLGSDCPFFIKNVPCYGQGRGEILQEIKLNLPSHSLVIVNPKIHVATGWAFSHLTPNDQRPSLLEAVQSPVENWKELLKNDFEPSIFQQYPEISKIKNDLYEQGAVYAAMSGSGSTIFGLFPREMKSALQFPNHYFVHEQVFSV